jgi:hypothetical protein
MTNTNVYNNQFLKGLVVLLFAHTLFACTQNSEEAWEALVG